MQIEKYHKMPPVGAVMTPFPHSVQIDDPVGEVERLMENHQIRHLPVQQDGGVVGIISYRDLRRLVNPALPRADKNRIRARNIFVPDPYVVDVATPLDEVVSQMAERHIGSAIVLRHDKLAGILSVTDVCRVLADLLRGLHPPPDDGVAA